MEKPSIWEIIKGIAFKLNVFRYARNLLLCLRYPFLRWYGDPLFPRYPQLRRFSLDWTWLDEIPIGWRKAFGMKMARELRKVGKSDIRKLRKSGRKASWSDVICWCQIKEKWGALVLDASASQRIMDVLDKYMVMSIGYCMDCGKKARYKTYGSVGFYCERCFEKHWERWHMTKDEIDALKKECRLGVDDIPKHTMYEDGQERELDFVEEYGIDLKSLWGLDK